MSSTVGDILDGLDRERGVEPPKPKVAEPFVPATLPDVPPLPAPGIYFGMPFEEYLALPALGSHGVGDIMASPMIFWSKHQWVSETARKQALKPVAASTAMTRLIGHAYHCRVLEGAEEYGRRFCRELAEEDCADALESTDQIKAAIKAKEAKPVSKVPDELPDGTAYERAAKKEDWIAQLLALDPVAKILSVMQERHRVANDGKQFVPADAADQIELAARMIELDPNANAAVTGGYPEVTLIWHCAETGVPMKARVDYLKLKAAVDLKTFANEHSSPESAIGRQIASYRYNLQASVYLEGIQAVKALMRGPFDGGTWLRWHKERGVDAEPLAWAARWAAQEAEPVWWWLFQQKGFAPITRLVRYDGGLSTRIATDDIVRQAKRRFREYSERYGTDPWLDIAEPWDISDDEIPEWSVRI